MIKISHPSIIAAFTCLSASFLEVALASSALGATFKYTTISTETTFTENPILVNGTFYDGTFINTVKFGSFQFTFSGFFELETGTLGQAISVKAVQKSPTDRTGIGEQGIARISYLDTPQDVAEVEGNVRPFPPNLTQYDFIFIPAPVAASQGEPTDLRLGWNVALIPEPGMTNALVVFGGGLGLSWLYRKKKLSI